MSGRGHGGRRLPPMSMEEEENKKVIKGSSYKCGVGADYLVSILLLPLTNSVTLDELPILSVPYLIFL